MSSLYHLLKEYVMQALYYNTHNDASLKKDKLVLNTKFKQALITELSNLNYKFEFGRNTAWLGSKGLDYKYTGKSHIASGWTSATEILTDKIREFLLINNRDEYFNHLLVNQYQAGMSLNKHRDNEPELHSVIASLSFGDDAWFSYGNNQDGWSNILLSDSDVLIGNRSFFNTVYHSVSKPQNDKVRYNLTWRTIK